MKFVHPEIENVFDTQNGFYNTLVVEEQRFLVRLLEDLHRQLQGLEGVSTLSVKDAPVSFAKNAALLDGFVPFDLTRRTLLNQISAALARKAAAAEAFDRTAEALSGVELWLNELAFDYPCDIVFSNLSASTLIKAAGPEIRDEAASIAERVLDYMELVEAFDRQRLFFTLNMRFFVADEEMELFARTAVAHGYHVIGIESAAHAMLSIEKRTIIDSDLCEIG